MSTRQIHLSLPDHLIKKVDTAAAEEFANRSDFIRLAIIERLQKVDERRARLQAIAATDHLPTEDELFELLQYKKRQRQLIIWNRERREELKKGTWRCDD